jgi:hypothetical protein
VPYLGHLVEIWLARPRGLVAVQRSEAPLLFASSLLVAQMAHWVVQPASLQPEQQPKHPAPLV